MKRLKAVTAGVLLTCALGAASLSGCGSVDGTKDAITVNGETMNLGTANFMLRYEQASAYNMMKSYGFIQEGATFWNQELNNDSSSSSSESVSTASSSSSSEEDYDADTYGEDYKHTLQEKFVERMLLREHADEYDGEIPDDLQKSIDETAKETYDANESVMKKMGTTEDDIKNALELMSYETLMRNNMTEDVDKNVSDEEASQSTVTYTRFNFSTENSEEGTDADELKKSKLQNAQEMIKQINATGDVANADFDSIAKEVDEDAYTAADYSFSTDPDDNSFDDTLNDAIKKLKDGEITAEPVEDDTYYYVIRLDQSFNREATDSQKETIINERKSQLYDDMIADWKKDATIEYSKEWEKLTITDEDSYQVKSTTSSSDTTSDSGSVTVPSTTSSSSAAEPSESGTDSGETVSGSSASSASSASD